MNGFKLEQVSLFKNLSKSELKIVADFLLSQKYSQGEKIFQKNSIRDKVIIIQAGLVQLQTEIAEHQQVIALFKSGDFLGEMALFEKDSLHQHDLEVASETLETLELSVAHWYKILKKYPSIAHTIHQNIVVSLKSRLDHANNKLVTLFASGQIIASYNDFDKMNQQIIEIIQKIIPCQKSLLATGNGSAEKFIVRYAKNYPKIKKYDVLDISLDPLLHSLSENPVTKILTKNSWPSAYKKLAYFSDSLIITPIKISKRLNGLIILGDKLNGRPFSTNNQILLDALASLLAPVIVEEQNKSLESSKEDLKRVYIEPLL